MNLNSYIPAKSFNILFGNHGINVSGICTINLEIDRLQGTYTVWVDTVAGAPLIGGYDSGKIMMSSMDVDYDVILEIDNFKTPGKIKRIDYSGMKHAYMVTIEVIIDKKKARPYMYKEDEEDTGDFTRFDILDL